MKSLKSVIIDWITPRGESLVPAIARNVKCDRGYNHDRTGGLLCPADLDWSKDEHVHFYFHPSRLNLPGLSALKKCYVAVTIQ